MTSHRGDSGSRHSETAGGMAHVQAGAGGGGDDGQDDEQVGGQPGGQATSISAQWWLQQDNSRRVHSSSSSAGGSSQAHYSTADTATRAFAAEAPSDRPAAAPADGAAGPKAGVGSLG